MQPIFGLTIYLSEENVLPVMLQNATGGELTGHTVSTIVASKSVNGAALSAFTPLLWSELGNGLYEFTMPASSLVAGTLAYRVNTSPEDGNPAFNGFAKVDSRQATYNLYQCHISPQYDEVTQEFSAFVWLSKDGQTVTNPLTCQIWLKDTGGNVPVNITGITPNADGVFVLTQSSIVLSLNMNYECLINVTDNDAVVHSSVDGALTFN